MSRILVCGPCPLPFENVSRSYGSGIRTWQFAWSLAAAGHEVRLLAVKTDGAYVAEDAPLAHEQRDGVDTFRLPYVEAMDPPSLRRRIKEFDPEAVVGATIFGSFALAQCAPRIPFWADHFGDAMAEAQAKARLEGSNWPLANFWRLAAPALRRADRISAVSTPQRHALIGELGAIGRLTAENCGYDLTAVIPCAAPETGDLPPPEGLREGRFASEDVLLLWSGSFNVWSDIDTLLDAVTSAMDQDARIHLVVTGGAVEGHDDETFARFHTRIEASPHRDRFHLEGWIPASRLPIYEGGADLGIVTELPIYEGMLGSKNRIVRWLMEGLPVACNRFGELGSMLAFERAALTFDPGDIAKLTDVVLSAARDPEGLRQTAARGRKLARERFTFTASTSELIAWAESPARAPDADTREAIRSPADFASLRFRLGTIAYRMPLLRRSRLARQWWRRWKAAKRS